MAGYLFIFIYLSVNCYNNILVVSIKLYNKYYYYYYVYHHHHRAGFFMLIFLIKNKNKNNSGMIDWFNISHLLY